MGRFRFALQMLLDERVREEERAHAVFLRAGEMRRQAASASQAWESAAAACDSSAHVALDLGEAGRAARKRALGDRQHAEDEARGVFERARRARLQLTVLREHAYGAFLEEEERAAAAESDETNRVSRLVRVCS